MPAITEGRYYIQLSTGRALEASTESFKSNGARVQTWKLYRGLNQLWELKKTRTGAFNISNIGGCRALDAHDTHVDRNGCRVQLYNAHPDNRNQQWLLQPLGSDRFAIRCAASRGNKVLQIKDNVVDRSGEAELADFLGTPGQIWTFTPAVDAAIVTSAMVDLRPNQTPIKSQGGRGSCTYFGATAALEAAYRKAGYGDVNLSEEFWTMMGKALYIHPHWPDIRDANYRENQFAGTQGGGALFWYSHGFRLPLESDVPYRPVDYVPSNWASTVQKEANDFNFSLFTRNVLQAPRYYSATFSQSIAPEQLRNSAAYEQILSLGYEISAHLRDETYGGAHNVLLVGFDKSNPSAPCFFVKNSWGPLGGDPRVHCERKTYAQILSDMASAEYLTDVSDPAPWPELAFLGRWNLTYDGHKGILDLYHIPGIGIWPRPSDPDRRLGVFYDSAGTAFRVNGTLSGNRIEFWIDGRKPNLAWHELTGRRFVYYLDPAVNVMAGLHYDGDGRSYGGYATKTNEVAHGKPAGSGLAALANTTWTMLLGERQGPVRFGDDLGGRVVGTMTDASGVSRGIEANLLDAGQLTFWSEGGLSVATAKFLSHEPGLICGNTNDGRPFYAAYVSSR